MQRSATACSDHCAGKASRLFGTRGWASFTNKLKINPTDSGSESRLLKYI